MKIIDFVHSFFLFFKTVTKMFYTDCPLLALRDSIALSLFCKAILIADADGQLFAFSLITKPAKELETKLKYAKYSF